MLLVLRMDLPLDRSTAGHARQAVLARFGDRARCADLLVCISEVLSNAVLHAHTAAQLELTQHGDVVRVEVADGDPRLPIRLEQDRAATNGRGLHLLDALTADWGATPVPGGKVVWFELDLART